jgi:hypothetical protein
VGDLAFELPAKGAELALNVTSHLEPRVRCGADRGLDGGAPARWTW